MSYAPDHGLPLPVALLCGRPAVIFPVIMSPCSAVRRERAQASLVLLGMADPREQEDGFVDRLDSVVEKLPNVLFVYSAGDLSLHA